MRSRNTVYPLLQGDFSVYIYGNHNNVSRCKSYSSMENGLNRRESFSFGATPSPDISDLAKARQDLPFRDSQIGPFEPSLYGTIIHAVLTLLAFVTEKM